MWLDPHTYRFHDAGDELYGLRVANTVRRPCSHTGIRSKWPMSMLRHFWPAAAERRGRRRCERCRRAIYGREVWDARSLPTLKIPTSTTQCQNARPHLNLKTCWNRFPEFLRSSVGSCQHFSDHFHRFLLRIGGQKHKLRFHAFFACPFIDAQTRWP